MYSIQRFGSVLQWGTVATSTTAALLFDGSSALRTTTNYIQGVQLTNVDTTNAIYIGYDNTVTSTKYVKKIAPGEFFETLLGSGALDKIYVVAAAATPSLSVAVLS